MNRSAFLRIAFTVALALGIVTTSCSDDDSSSTPSGTAGSGAAGPGGNGQGGSVQPAADAGPPPESLGDCPAFAPGNDLKICTATYLGGAGADEATAVDIAADGTVVVAGAFPSRDFGQAASALLGGGDGAVIRLSPAGGKVLSISRLPSKATDLALDSTSGMIAIGGDFGVALLEANASALVWANASQGPVRRVTVGSDHVVAALAGKTVALFEQDGSPAGSFELTDGTISDLAVHGESASVIVTGFNQVSGNLQQPFLRAYAYDGTLEWKAYDWSAADAAAFGSDTRGYAVSIGRDGMLYYAGESHGGSTTHLKDPRDLARDAPIVRNDKYNDSYDWNGAAPLSFFARFDPSDGTQMLAGLIAPRLSSGKGNGAHIEAITASEDGVVLLGGSSACCIEGGAEKTINGLPAMPGYAGGGFAFAVSQDFKTRLLWTAFSGVDGSGAETKGVAARAGAMAIVQTQGPDKTSGAIQGHLLTSRALQPDPGGGVSEGFLSVWRSP